MWLCRWVVGVLSFFCFLIVLVFMFCGVAEVIREGGILKAMFLVFWGLCVYFYFTEEEDDLILYIWVFREEGR